MWLYPFNFSTWMAEAAQRVFVSKKKIPKNNNKQTKTPKTKGQSVWGREASSVEPVEPKLQAARQRHSPYLQFNPLAIELYGPNFKVNA